jgi:hypothetical protein
MHFTDLETTRALMDARVEDVQRRLECESLLRQAGLKRRIRRPWQGRWLLGQLGRQMVVLGERMEQYGLPQPSR